MESSSTATSTSTTAVKVKVKAQVDVHRASTWLVLGAAADVRFRSIASRCADEPDRPLRPAR